MQTMLELESGSLLLVSAFGLLDGLAVVLASPVVGAYIDRSFDMSKPSSPPFKVHSPLSAAPFLVVMPSMSLGPAKNM